MSELWQGKLVNEKRFPMWFANTATEGFAEEVDPAFLGLALVVNGVS